MGKKEKLLTHISKKVKKVGKGKYKKNQIEKFSPDDLSDSKIHECNSEDIEKKFGITLKTQYGILPATKIPGTNLIVEDVLLLSFAFPGNPWEISSVTICATVDEIKQKERDVLKLLVEKANNSAMCDDDGEGRNILEFFKNVAVVPIRYEDIPSTPDGNTYYRMKSLQGFSFDDIKNEEEYKKLMDTNPDNVFFFRLVEKDLLH